MFSSVQFLGKIAASRQQDDGVHLTVLWETGPIPKDGEETKFKFSRPSSRCTYIAYELSVENAFVFEERKGDKVTKFAAGLWPAGHEPMYSSGQYLMMPGGFETRDSSLAAGELQAHDFAFKMQKWRDAACKVPFADDRVNTGIEDVLDLDDMSEAGMAAWEKRISAVKLYGKPAPEMALAVNESPKVCAPQVQETAEGSPGSPEAAASPGGSSPEMALAVNESPKVCAPQVQETAEGSPGSPEAAASPGGSSTSSASAEVASNSSESFCDSSSSGAAAAAGGGTSATGITSAEYISFVVRGGCQLLVFGCTCKTTTWKSWDVCTCGEKVRKTGGWPPQRHCTRPDFVFDR